MENKEYAFLFIEGPLPETERFTSSRAFSVAGNNAVKGIVLSLKKNGLEPDLILAHFMQESFPRNKKLFFWSERIETQEGLKIKLLPFFNLTPIKQLTLGINVFFEILTWGLRNKGKRRIVCSYNLTVPPLIFILSACQIIKARKIAIAYDINIPGGTAGKGLKHRLDYGSYVRFLKAFDGLINIREEIAQELAPKVKSIVVEPGISENSLAILKNNKKEKTNFFNIVFAGPLEERNGILEAIASMKFIKAENLRLNIIGDGEERNSVLKASMTDNRIVFWGWQPYTEVLKIYGFADVVLNLFMYKKIDSHYVYPSKLIECLASGVPTITTNFCKKIALNLQDKAFLLQGETPEEIAATIEKIKNMDKLILNEITQRAQAYIVKEYSWDVQGKKIADFITDFLLKGS